MMTMMMNPVEVATTMNMMTNLVQVTATTTNLVQMTAMNRRNTTTIVTMMNPMMNLVVQGTAAQ